MKVVELRPGEGTGLYRVLAGGIINDILHLALEAWNVFAEAARMVANQMFGDIPGWALRSLPSRSRLRIRRAHRHTRTSADTRPEPKLPLKDYSR